MSNVRLCKPLSQEFSSCSVVLLLDDAGLEENLDDRAKACDVIIFGPEFFSLSTEN